MAPDERVFWYRRLSRSRQVALALGALALVVVLVAASYVGFLLGKIRYEKLTADPLKLGITDQAAEKTEQHHLVNVLLMGTDSHERGGKGRSDTMIVVTLDKDAGGVKMTSFMRDLYVAIPGRGKNRLNAAYAFGGPELTLKTINSDFGVDVRDYVEIDLQGLEKVVDRLGGLDLSLDPDEAKYTNAAIDDLNKTVPGKKAEHVKAGSVHLDGRQTVAYTRVRHAGNADFDRTERQRKVLGLLMAKVKSRGVAALPGLISTLSPYVKTSLSRTDILTLSLRALRENVVAAEQFRLPVSDGFSNETVDDMMVLVPDMEYNKLRLQEFLYGESSGAQ